MSGSATSARLAAGPSRQGLRQAPTGTLLTPKAERRLQGGPMRPRSQHGHLKMRGSVPLTRAEIRLYSLAHQSR